MARCTRCVAVLPFDAWWCPQCATRSTYAPRGVDRRRPAGVPQAAELDSQWQAAYLGRIRRRRRRRFLGGAGVLAGSGLLAGLLTAFAGGSAPPDGPVKVPLLFGESLYGTSFNAPAGITISLGGNQSIPVIVDTGSIGLRVFASTITTTKASGVTVTSAPDRVTLADGSVWSGHVARATLRIGGISTVAPIPFQLVTAISCAPGQPDCPSAGGIAEAVANATYGYGLLGIGLGGPAPGDPLVNPLSALPPPYGRNWDVDLADYSGSNTDAGMLTLGPSTAPPPPGTTTVIPLRRTGTAGGVPLWDDRPTLCWSFATRRTCQPTVLDSGSGLMIVGPAVARMPTVPMGTGLPNILGGNVQVTVALPGRQSFWGFDTGGSPGSSAVAVVDGQSGVNSGVQLFFSFDVHYDLDTGTITLRLPPGT